MTKPNQSNQRGAIAILSLLGVTTFALAVISTVAVLAIGELKQANAGGPFEQTYYAAESGLNEGLYRLVYHPGNGDYILVVNDVVVAIGTTVPDDPFQRVIHSQSTSESNTVKTVQVIANTSSAGSGLDYALQAAGPITMENDSTIEGNVYSNSSIEFQSGAGASITGETYYNGSIDSRILVQGSPCPNVHCNDNAAPKDLPYDDDFVQVLKDVITDAGLPILTPNPGQCPGGAPAGTYCVVGSQSLGNQKINGNLYLNNNAVLTLTDNIWVTGNIIFNNNSTIGVSTGQTANDSYIIADGIVDVGNNVSVCPTGTCDSDSFIVIISTNPSTNLTAPAIWASNNSNSIVFAAINGVLKVKQNGRLNAAAAQELYLEQNSTVIYDNRLSSISSPSGGGPEPVGTAFGTWQEL